MSIKQLEDASAVYKKLLDSMAKVDKKYSTEYVEQKVDAPESLGLKKLEYDMPSDEEIEEVAKQYFRANRESDISKINTSTQKSLNDLEKKAKSVLEEALKGQIKIDEEREKNLKRNNYDSQVKNLTNSSIKTGMENSINTLADDALKVLNSDTDNAIGNIDIQKQQLKELSERQLEDLEKVYAQKVATKVAELIEDAQEQLDSVTKYNNSVDEKEAKYKKSLESMLKELEEKEWDRVAEMLKLKNTIGESGVNQQKAEEKYRAIKSILDEYSPSDALQMLESSSAFKLHLGDLYDSLKAYYFNKLN